jgi:hypothetical protein
VLLLQLTFWQNVDVYIIVVHNYVLCYICLNGMYFCLEYCGVLHKLKSLGMRQRHMGKWMFSSTHS